MTDAEVQATDSLRHKVRSRINELRANFEGSSVKEIDADTVRDGIKSPVETATTEALQRKPFHDELESFADWVVEAEDKIPNSAKSLEDKINQLREMESSEVDAKYLDLLELGESVIEPDADRCPLCEQGWTESRPLVQAVRRRREELESVQELRSAIEKEKSDVQDFLRSGQEHLKYLTRELNIEENPEGESLVEFSDDVSKTIDFLTGDILEPDGFDPDEIPILSILDSKLTADFQEVVEDSDTLVEKANELEDLTKKEEQYEKIQTLANNWEEYERLGNRVSELEFLADAAEKARSAFVQARREVIGEIYDDIAERVESYYARIHPDEIDTETSIKITNTGAELEKDFYETGKYPPHAIHSEGHLDTYGLCLHLALTDYLQQGNRSMLLLDDVVMSVDQDHRLEIAKLLADEFSEEYQIIITTHDELWAEQLKSQGVLRGGSQIWLREWSFEGGITESRRRIDVEEQWETVQEAMDDDETQRAAHELRYALERMLQQTAVAIGAKIEYDPRQRHTVGDFKSAVSRRLGDLTGKARDNLHPPENEEDEEMFEAAGELDDAYGRVLDNVGQNLQKINRRVHWTPGKWLTLGPAEFEEVFEAHKEAYDLLYCDECGSSIRYERFDGYHELRCNCRQKYDINWN
ncbi:MAG: hypothetical protein U5K70_00945 [Halodesulfurarchaeum sp.]|nr:hypothetical protein [Halodesulfurarchaeum sp.]